jgi:hypothetical protein
MLTVHGDDNFCTELVFVYITLLQQLVIAVCSDPVTLYFMFPM